MNAVLFGWSDATWQSLITVLGGIVLALLQQRTKTAVDKGSKEAVQAAVRAEAKADDVAVKVSSHAAEAKEEMDARLTKNTRLIAENTDLTAKTLDVVQTIHTISNGGKRVLLQQCAELAERVARLTLLPGDLAAAALAREALAAHAARQTQADESKHPAPQETKP